MRNLKLLLITAVSVFICSCATADIQTNETQGQWQQWEGRGHAVVRDSSLVYYADSLQDEEYDYDIEGRGPALILSKQVKGKKWTMDIKQTAFSTDKSFNRFSIWLWFGKTDQRPSLGSKNAKMVLSVIRTRGQDPLTDGMSIEIRNGKDTKTVKIPDVATFIRFERIKNEIKVYYSGGFRPKYKEATAVHIPSKADVRFAVGARYDGKIWGKPRIDVNSITLDGNDFFK